MHKSTHFTGQPLYCQLLNFLDKQEIKQTSREGGFDRYVKKLDGYSHFVILLYGVLMRHDSLREIVVGMLSEAHKLQHLGIDYMVRRSTLSEANNRRSSEFFEQIYFSLYKQYKTVLPDSRDKSWEKVLHIMDSTTISLFSNVLKGVGRNPKHGKKKGGIKVHTVLRATEGVPHSVHFTSAATHDHVMLKKLTLSSGSFIAMDRAYIDYRVFEQFTQDGVFYVTKMKKNQRFKHLDGCYLVNDRGLIVLNDSIVEFEKDEIKHTSRKVEYWGEQNKKHSTILLTNNFELDPEQIIEIYRRRWQIELLFKQLKQNFPLKYFFGESVNAIQTQIWITLIANLLLTVVKKRVKRDWSFSNLVTMIRQTLMYYIDLYQFCENPENAWLKIIAQRNLSPPEQTLFD